MFKCFIQRLSIFSAASGLMLTGICADQLAEKPRVVIGGIRDGAFILKWRPDSTQLASYGGEEVQVWSVRTGSRVARFGSSQQSYPLLAWSPDGTHLAFGENESSVRIVTTTGRSSSIHLRGHGGTVRSIDWSTDNRRIALGTTEGLWLYRLSGSLGRPSRLATFDTSGIGWSRKGDLAAVSSAGRLEVWRQGKGPSTVLRDVREELPGVFDSARAEYRLAWSPDGHLLAAPSITQRGLCVWKMGRHPTKRVVPVPQAIRGADLRWSPGGRYLLAAFGTVQALDLRTGESHVVPDCDVNMFSTSWHPNGKYLACASDSTVRVWDVVRRKRVRTLHLRAGSAKRITLFSTAWSADGERVAAGGVVGEEARIVIW